MSAALFRRVDKFAAWLPVPGEFTSIVGALECVQKVGLSGEFRAVRGDAERPGPDDEAQLTIESKRPKTKTGQREQLSPMEEKICRRGR